MASFTDSIIQFNPYVQQVPVEAYANVGMQKQGEYDRGVEAANNYLENIAGLAVIHPEQKEYLNQRVNQVQSELNSINGADFSSKQLTSEIKNMAMGVMKDPIIQNAVKSTERYQSGMAQLQKAQAEGKSAPENAWDFQNQANAWLNNKDANSSFNGAYTPYVDVRKKILDVINKDVPEDERITQVPFRRNPDGTTFTNAEGNVEIDEAMLKSTWKGKNPQKIINAVMASLDNNDMAQLAVEGRYHYQGKSPEDLKETVDKNFQSRLNFYNTKIADLENKKKLDTTDKQAQKDIDGQIEEIKKKAGEINGKYTDSINALNKNPEAFKSNFYLDNYLEQIGNAFSSSKESYEYMTNPYRQQMNDEREFNLKVADSNWKREMDKLNYELNVSKASSEKKKADEEASGLVDAPILGPAPTDIAKPTEATFLNTIKAEEDQLIASKNNILASVYPGLSAKQAEEKLLEVQEAYDQGKVPEVRLKSYFDLTRKANKVLMDKKMQLLKIREEADASPQFNIKNMVKSEPGLQIGKTDLTPEELLNFRRKIQAAEVSTVNESGTTYTYYDDNKAKQILTPKELVAYNSYKKTLNRSTKSAGDNVIINRITELGNKYGNKMNEVLKAKNDFIDKKIQDQNASYLPESYTVDASKPATQYAAKSMVSRILGNAAQQKESLGLSPNFDYDKALAMNNDKKAEPVYGVYKQGSQAYITMDNGTGIQYLPINNTNLKSIFPEKFDKPFDPIKENLLATKGRTTNIQGVGDGRPEDHATAQFDRSNFRNVKNYGISADIEGAPGGYQLRLYIFDKNDKQAKWVSVPDTKLYTNENEILDFIDKIGDNAIDQLLGKTK